MAIKPHQKTHRPLRDVVADGFAPVHGSAQITQLALASLRVSLASWMSARGKLHEHPANTVAERRVEDWSHTWEYFVTYAEAIVHLQHFAELVCKDFLRAEHELLATVVSENPSVMYRLLMKHPVPEIELAQQKSVEFSRAIDTLVALIKAGQVGADLSFVATHKEALHAINSLRNRLWHRGTFTLRIHALDELFGRFMLPFVNRVTGRPEYAAVSKIWRPSTFCQVDVLKELEIEFARTDSDPNPRRIAYLKELGRASFSNPLHEPGLWPQQQAREAAIESAKRQRNIQHILDCPCCGVRSLVLVHLVIDNGEEVIVDERFVKCECCTFHVPEDYGSASDLQLPLQDFFAAPKQYPAIRKTRTRRRQRKPSRDPR